MPKKQSANFQSVDDNSTAVQRPGILARAGLLREHFLLQGVALMLEIRGAEGDSVPAKIEERLEHSHVLVFCMSANAFGSDWAPLGAHPDALERSAG
jgi:hypothetical protein